MEQNRVRQLAVMAAALLAAGPAMAGGLLDIDGSYGNEAGCATIANPDASVSDEMIVLNSESASSYASYCTFKKLVASTAGARTFESSCGSEGEETEETLQLTVVDNGNRTFTVRFSTGEEWGPLARCQ